MKWGGEQADTILPMGLPGIKMPDTNRIYSAVKRLEAEARNAVAVHATLMHANNLVPLRKALADTYGAHAYNVLHRALLEQLTMLLARIHDAPAENRASLPNVMGMLREDSLRAKMIDDARQWEPRPGQALEDAERHWLELLDQFGGDPLKSIRAFRNENLAHALYDMPPAPSVLFGYLSDIYGASLEVVAKVVLAIFGRDVDFQDSERIHTKYAKEFWLFVTRGALAGKG